MGNHLLLANYTQPNMTVKSADWSYQVKGFFGYPYAVALDNKVCSCQVFQKLKIPCGHALLVADSLGFPMSNLLGMLQKSDMERYIC